MIRLVSIAIFFGFAAAPLRSESIADLKAWIIDGSVQMDSSKPTSDGKPSIRLDPKSNAVIKLRPEDGSGKLTLSVYDDGTASVADKKKAVGPRWGLIQKDGRVLVGGVVYGRSFAANGSFGIIEADPAQKGAWAGPVFAGPRGKPGWMTWEFAYDPDKGVSISIDGKPVPQKYFNWNLTKAIGFNGIVFFGDATESPTPETAWIGGISYELGGPMKVKPGDAAAPGSAASAQPLPAITAPAPPPESEGSSMVAPLIADTPAYVPGTTLVDDLNNFHVVPAVGYLAHHPRLIFSASDREALQQKAKDNPELWTNVLAGARGLADLPTPDAIQTGARYFKIRSVEAAAVAWFVTGDKKYQDDATRWMVAHCQQPVWGTGFRSNLDLQASWYLYYLSISYDILYSQLNDADRKTIRDGLAAHAKLIYDSFDPASFAKGKIPYDQNHTYNPAVALTAAALALYGNVPEAGDWLNRAHAMMQRSRYVLNEDGYYYEGFGYWQYALHWHARYAEMMARATGEKLYDLPALRDNWLFGLHISLPGAPGGFDIDDSYAWKDGARPIADVNNYALLWNIAQANQSGESRAVADMYLHRHADKDDPATAFLWFSSGVKAADLDQIKPYHLFPDQDVVFWRSSWKPDATCYYFRSGPPLGHKAAAKLSQLKDWEMNCGHVHADIGSFGLFAKGAYLAIGTGYTAEKWTKDQNTILIDGKGQAADGEYHNERGVPYADLDGAHIDKSFLGDAYGFVSGDYGSAYAHLVPGVQLHRSLLMTPRWLLVVDDMASEKDHALTWLCHADSAFTAEGSAFVARLPKAALAVIPLSAPTLMPAMEPCTVVAGKAPGQGHPEQHGFQLSLTQPQPAKSARLINLLVPLDTDEKLPVVALTKQEKDLVEFNLKWPDGNEEKVALNLGWTSGTEGPATISTP